MSDSSPQATNSKTLAVLIAALLVAVVLRVALWSTQGDVSQEGARILMTSKIMGTGIPWDEPHPIGYSVMIRALDVIGFPAQSAARGLDVLAGLTAVALAWMAVRRRVSTWWLPALPALAVACMPLTVRYSLGTQPDMVYLALILGAVVLGQRQRWLGAGLLLGVAAQVRPEALVVLGAMLALRRARAAWAPLVLGTLGTFALIWLAQGALLQVWDPLPQILRTNPPLWMDRELAEPVAAPAFLERVVALVRNTLVQGGWLIPVLGLAALAGPAPLAAAAVAPVLVSPFIHLGDHPRFVLLWLPFLWILGAVFLDRLRPGMRLAGAAVCVVGLGLTAWSQAPTAYTVQEDGDYPELRAAGRYLADYVRPDMVLTGLKPQTAYHAGLRFHALPAGYTEYHEAVDAIVASGADFFVAHQQTLHREYPALVPLVEDKPVVWHEHRLEPVYFDNSYMDGQIVVYRVVRPGGLGPLPSEGRAMRRQIGVIDHGKNHEFHGQVARMAKKFTTCADEYLLASNRNPGTPESAFALNNRAWCLLQHGDYDAAKTEANRALEILPHQEEFIDTMIEIVKAMGQTRAEEYWRGKLEEARAANAAAPDGAEGQ